MSRRFFIAVLAAAFVVLPTSGALACGGLIGPNGAVNLTRTTTLAAHHNGVEHYVTAFNYAGGGGEFGSIIPLPAMPSKVEKGGDWTLQRLQQETAPVRAQTLAAASGAASARSAEEVYKTRIDALDITVLKGGGESVGIWAADHGFRLPPDAPEVLDFYAQRSQYFLAAVFDSETAEERGQQIGDGTPIHITIPLSSPWVPLRILGLGKQPAERVEADVYLLTDHVPDLLPLAGNGYTVERQVPATDSLLADLRSDRGMEWMPASGMTLTHLIVNASAPQLRYDLAINARGGAPSIIRAGLGLPKATDAPLKVPTPTPVITPDLALDRAPETISETAGGRTVWPIALAVAMLPLAALIAWRFSRRPNAKA